MTLFISGVIALVLLFMHKYFSTVRGSSDVQTGVMSSLFWFLFAGAGWVSSSNGDLTNIYFYFFFFGIGMAIAVLISALNFSPTKEVKQEQSGNKGGMDGMRKRAGWRPLNRNG